MVVENMLEDDSKGEEPRTQDGRLSASEAVFGFCGWLTCREDVMIVGAGYDCAKISELCKQFCEVNRLGDPRDEWTDYLTHPPTVSEEDVDHRS